MVARLTLPQFNAYSDALRSGNFHPSIAGSFPAPSGSTEPEQTGRGKMKELDNSSLKEAFDELKARTGKNSFSLLEVAQETVDQRRGN